MAMVDFTTSKNSMFTQQAITYESSRNDRALEDTVNSYGAILLHRCNSKKYIVTVRRVMDALREHKPSQFKQHALLIEGFKPGASCCLLVGGNKGPTVKMVNFHA